MYAIFDIIPVANDHVVTFTSNVIYGVSNVFRVASNEPRIGEVLPWSNIKLACTQIWLCDHEIISILIEP